jgi:hypothetical protein
VKVENKLLEGPKDDLGGFLSAVDQLHTNVEFLKQNQSFKATSFALDHANGLLSKSMTQLIEEFKNLFNEHRFGNFQLPPLLKPPICFILIVSTNPKVCSVLCLFCTTQFFYSSICWLCSPKKNQKNLGNLVINFLGLVIFLCSKPVESTSFTESLLNENQQVGSPQSHDNSEDVTLLTSSFHNDNTSDPQVLPDVILPDVIPQLCEMVQWLVAAGHQEQCLETYR